MTHDVSTRDRHPLVTDAAIVLGTFLVLGVIGALLWWQLTPLAEFTRTAGNAQMDEEQLGRQVASDGWFFVIAVVGGLVAGIVLLGLRRRDPLAMVVLVTLGGFLATGVMRVLGRWLGPGDPKDALAGAAVGDRIPVQLETHADGLLLVWSIAALLGAVAVLWGLDDHRRHAPEPAAGGETTFRREEGLGSPRSG